MGGQPEGWWTQKLPFGEHPDVSPLETGRISRGSDVAEEKPSTLMACRAPKFWKWLRHKVRLCASTSAGRSCGAAWSLLP